MFDEKCFTNSEALLFEQLDAKASALQWTLDMTDIRKETMALTMMSPISGRIRPVEEEILETDGKDWFLSNVTSSMREVATTPNTRVHTWAS
jgi:hypothetical protein